MSRPRPRPPLAAPPPEAVLHELWAGRRFPEAALVTRQGVPVRVLRQGRRGRGPGPDFRGALIAGPSGLPVRGDIELHVRASDFRAHGHHLDPAYDRVVLHVVFEDDTGADTALRCGREVPVVALGPWVARRAGEIERWLARPALWREPCHDASSRLGDAVPRTLDALGDARFEDRAEALREAALREGPEQALYAALLEGLGYGADRERMLALARHLPWHDALRRSGGDALTLEALLLGAAGLLRPAGAPAGGSLERRWRTAGAGLTPLPGQWAPARPANHPARRLAGLAALLARAGRPSALLAAVAAAPGPGVAVALFTVAPPRESGPALIGRSRAIELLVNAALPFLAGAAEGGAGGRARELFRSLPRPGPYGALAFLETQLRVPGGPLTARRQQGLLALHRRWCGAGGCGRCPLS